MKFELIHPSKWGALYSFWHQKYDPQYAKAINEWREVNYKAEAPKILAAIKKQEADVLEAKFSVTQTSAPQSDDESDNKLWENLEDLFEDEEELPENGGENQEMYKSTSVESLNEENLSIDDNIGNTESEDDQKKCTPQEVCKKENSSINDSTSNIKNDDDNCQQFLESATIDFPKVKDITSSQKEHYIDYLEDYLSSNSLEYSSPISDNVGPVAEVLQILKNASIDAIRKINNGLHINTDKHLVTLIGGIPLTKMKHELRLHLVLHLHEMQLNNKGTFIHVIEKLFKYKESLPISELFVMIELSSYADNMIGKADITTHVKPIKCSQVLADFFISTLFTQDAELHRLFKQYTENAKFDTSCFESILANLVKKINSKSVGSFIIKTAFEASHNSFMLKSKSLIVLTHWKKIVNEESKSFSQTFCLMIKRVLSDPQYCCIFDPFQKIAPGFIDTNDDTRDLYFIIKRCMLSNVINHMILTEDCCFRQGFIEKSSFNAYFLINRAISLFEYTNDATDIMWVEQAISPLWGFLFFRTMCQSIIARISQLEHVNKKEGEQPILLNTSVTLVVISLTLRNWFQTLESNKENHNHNDDEDDLYSAKLVLLSNIANIIIADLLPLFEELSQCHARYKNLYERELYYESKNDNEGTIGTISTMDSNFKNAIDYFHKIRAEYETLKVTTKLVKNQNPTMDVVLNVFNGFNQWYGHHTKVLDQSEPSSFIQEIGSCEAANMSIVPKK